MENSTFKIYDTEDVGEVQITEEVIAIIAGLAATEVEGVEAMAGNISNDIVAKLGRKNLAAGVKVLCDQGRVFVNLSLILKLGANFHEVAENVQEKVKSAIENMTGLTVESVNVKVANIKGDN